jgi:hypothetical protein
MQKGINQAGSWTSGKAEDCQPLGEAGKEHDKLRTSGRRSDQSVKRHKARTRRTRIINRELRDQDDNIPDIQKVAAHVIAHGRTQQVFNFDELTKVPKKPSPIRHVRDGRKRSDRHPSQTVGPHLPKGPSIIDDCSNVRSMLLTTKD